MTVNYLKTGNSVEIDVDDRGPHAKGRIVALSKAAGQKLGMIDDGHGDVMLHVVAGRPRDHRLVVHAGNSVIYL